TAPGRLYLLSHHLEKSGAKVIMNSEFNIPNQVAGTSAFSEENSLFIFHNTIPQITKKLNERIKLPKEYFLNVCENNFIRTYEIIASGTIVSRVSTILNVSPALPSSTR